MNINLSDPLFVATACIALGITVIRMFRTHKKGSELQGAEVLNIFSQTAAFMGCVLIIWICFNPAESARFNDWKLQALAAAVIGVYQAMLQLWKLVKNP